MKLLQIISILLLTNVLFGQKTFPDLSAKCSIKQKAGFTSISINYERPAARGRKIFGALIPYNELWRTGAGHCTKIGFNTAVFVGNKKIEKGVYSLFTVPGKKEWTIIFNKDTTLYGTSGYDEKKDAIRLKAKSQSAVRHYESLTLDIDILPNNARIYIAWEETQTSFDILTETDKDINDFIQKTLLTDQSKDPEEYALAAEYYHYLNTNADLALILIDKAIAMKTESWYYRQKIDILEKSGNYSEAINCANLIISINQKRTDWDLATRQQSNEEYNKRIITLKNKLKGRVSE